VKRAAVGVDYEVFVQTTTCALTVLWSSIQATMNAGEE
jgi:hypothetical protein